MRRRWSFLVLLAAAGILGPAYQASAQLRIVPDSGWIEVNRQHWKQLSVQFHVDPGNRNKRPYFWRIEVRDARGVLLSPVRTALRNLVRDAKILEAIDVPGPGSYQVTGVAQFADDGPCATQSCTVTLKFPPIAVERPRPKVHVLLLGINNYMTLPKLRFAENDVIAVHRFLTRVLKVPSERVVLLTSTPTDDPQRQIFRATKDKILDRLEDLLDNVGDQDLVLIYYSGHGVRLSGEWFLAPVDAELSSDRRRIKETRAIGLKEWGRLLEKLPAKHVLLYVDACFSGTLTENGIRGISFDPEETVVPSSPLPATGPWSTVISRRSRHVFAASKSGELAHEVYLDKKDLKVVTLDQLPDANAEGHGFFTFSFLRALEAELGRSDLGVDLTGGAWCGGQPCESDTNKISNAMKTQKTWLAVEDVYRQLTTFMADFQERYNRSHGEAAMVQTPSHYTLEEGVPIRLSHYELMQNEQ